MPFTLIPKSQFVRSTWKNGLGFTDQIAIYPPTATLQRGDFLWRLSSAQIDQGSPFSLFPEHDRVLVVLKGAGLRLFHQLDDEVGEFDSAEIKAFKPYDFPGDVPSRCELLAGSVTDLSLFVRKGECEGAVQVTMLQEGAVEEISPGGRLCFLISPEANLSVQACQGQYQSNSPATQKCDVTAGDVLMLEDVFSVAIELSRPSLTANSSGQAPGNILHGDNVKIGTSGRFPVIFCAIHFPGNR